MKPVVRDIRDALIGAALFFTAQALVSDADAATCKEIDMLQTHGIPVATTLPSAEEALAELLALVGVEVDAGTIGEWSDWKQNRAEDWAGSVLLRKSAGSAPLPKPGFLNAYLTSDGGVRT